MTAGRRAAAARLAALGGALAAGAACVRVETGPEAIAATRLADTPPSVVRGDVLRDASGAATPLAATAYDERGSPIENAPIRFYYVPGLGDTTGGTSRDTALVVDSLTGALSSNPSSARAQGVVAVRVGPGLQVLDTIQIVRAPARGVLSRAVVDTLRYDCTDDRLTVAAPPDTGSATTFVYNASRPFTLTVYADASDTSTVPARLVRWTVVSPSVPATPLPGGAVTDTVPALTVVDATGGTRQLLDTTSSAGASTVRLRIRPTGLGRTVLAAAATNVVLQGVVQPGPGAVAGGTVTVTVPIRREALAVGAAPACQ